MVPTLFHIKVAPFPCLMQEAIFTACVKFPFLCPLGGLTVESEFSQWPHYCCTYNGLLFGRALAGRNAHAAADGHAT